LEKLKRKLEEEDAPPAPGTIEKDVVYLDTPCKVKLPPERVQRFRTHRGTFPRQFLETIADIEDR